MYYYCVQITSAISTSILKQYDALKHYNLVLVHLSTYGKYHKLRGVGAFI